MLKLHTCVLQEILVPVINIRSSVKEVHFINNLILFGVKPPFCLVTPLTSHPVPL